MAASGAYPTDKENVDDFELIEMQDEIIHQKIPTIRLKRIPEDSGLRALAHLLNEMNTRVTTVANQFYRIEQAKHVIERNCVHHRKTGLGDYGARAMGYISSAQLNAMFDDDYKIRTASAKTLKETFMHAVQELNNHRHLNDTHFKQTIENLIAALDKLIVPYLDTMFKASKLRNEFDKLTPKQQKWIIESVRNELTCDFGTDAAGAFQHVMRVPLMMKSLQDALEKSPHESIRALASQLQEIRTNKIDPEMAKINAAMPENTAPTRSRHP